MTDRVRSDQETVRSRHQQARDADEPEAVGRSAPSVSREQALVAGPSFANAGLTDRERNERWPLG